MERQDVIDRYVAERAARHLPVGGIARVLHDRQAAAALDRLQAGRPVVQHPCEQNADHARRAACRGRTEQRIDRRARPVLARPPAHVEMIMTHDRMQGRWGDVHPTLLEPLSLCGGHHRQGTASAEDLRKQAGLVVGRMHHHEECGRQVAGQSSQQLPKRLDPSRRSTDDDHVAIRTLGVRRADCH
jgi:hypothetical protein